MSIKYRVIILLTALATLYILVTSQVLRLGVLPAFDALEKDFSLADRTRVNQYFAAELARLDSLVDDYSSWTAAYNFVLEDTPGFIEENLTDAAQYSLHANIIGFIDREGDLKWGGTFDIENEVPVDPREYLDLPLSESALLFNPEHDRVRKVGFLKGPGPAVIFSSRPIVPTNRDKEPVGTFVLGRILDDYFAREMQEQLSLNIKFWDVDAALPPEVSALFADLEFGLLDSAQIDNEEETRMFFTSRDLNGKTAFVMEVSSPRRIANIGAATLVTAVTMLVGTLVLFMLITWITLDKLILAPVRELHSHIHRMGEDEDLSQRISLSRSDEFGKMADEFNALTGKLQESRQESESARQESELAREEAESARQKAQAASESKSNFLATMSHEIRTPMNGVLGMAELLLTTSSLSAEQRHYAKTISRSGGALLRILNDILDFSKIEAGKFVLEQSQFQLHEVLEDSVELVAHEAQTKGLELVLDLPPDLHDSYKGDPGRIRQMLLNLLSNAVKFTSEGETILRVRSESEDKGTRYLLLEVEDTGIGIKQENHHKLFKTFSQEDHSTTRQFGGTGLGLAVTRKLAELMGGEVGFSSVSGSGSTFWLRIPLIQCGPVASPANRKEVNGTNEAKPGGGLLQYGEQRFLFNRALLLLKNTPGAICLARQIEYWGVNTEKLEKLPDLEEAVATQMAAAERCNLVVFVDSSLLGSGIQASMQSLREQHSSARLRFILLCPITEVIGETELAQFGMARLLHSPIRREALAECFLSSRSFTAAADTEALGNTLSGDNGSEQAGSVLLVEDNKVNVLVAEQMLKKLSYDVTTANNGKEAVELFGSKPFDFILMDCSMPVMDGYEATQKIREAEAVSDNEKVTIIALTANAMHEDRERCLNAGMDSFIAKPISIESLSQSLRH